jgi:hypothetical protein
MTPVRPLCLASLLWMLGLPWLLRLPSAVPGAGSARPPRSPGAAARPSTPPVLARHASQSNTDGQAAATAVSGNTFGPAAGGPVSPEIDEGSSDPPALRASALRGSCSSAGPSGAISNATVGVESSAECDGVVQGGFVVFGVDVSRTRPGDLVPLDVPDDHGIRQRRRPSTVPRSPPPAGQRPAYLSSPQCYCHRCGRANQRLIPSRAFHPRGMRSEYRFQPFYWVSAASGSCLAGRVSASQPIRPSG